MGGGRRLGGRRDAEAERRWGEEPLRHVPDSFVFRYHFVQVVGEMANYGRIVAVLNIWKHCRTGYWIFVLMMSINGQV